VEALMDEVVEALRDKIRDCQVGDVQVLDALNRLLGTVVTYQLHQKD